MVPYAVISMPCLHLWYQNFRLKRENREGEKVRYIYVSTHTRKITMSVKVLQNRYGNPYLYGDSPQHRMCIVTKI